MTATARETGDGPRRRIPDDPARFRTGKRRTLATRVKAASRFQSTAARCTPGHRHQRAWLFVEAQATCPVGTLLHLRLELNGLKVECKAAGVRLTYPPLGRGIAFVDMSEERGARLKPGKELHLAPIGRLTNHEPTWNGPATYRCGCPHWPAGWITCGSDPKAAIDALFTFRNPSHAPAGRPSGHHRQKPRPAPPAVSIDPVTGQRLGAPFLARFLPREVGSARGRGDGCAAHHTPFRTLRLALAGKSWLDFPLFARFRASPLVMMKG